MKHLIRSTLAAALVAVSLSTATYAAEKDATGAVDFGKLTASESGEFVEVNIKGNLISMAARIAQESEPEIAEVLRGLKHVRVNVIGLGNDNREEVQKRVKEIRSELDGKGWERIVTAQKKSEDVSVFIKTRSDEAVEGLVVTVMQDNREAVLVNIVGDIKPEKVAMIGERFNIEPLKKLGPSLEKKTVSQK